MGTSTSWIAVQASSFDEVAQALSLVRVESVPAGNPRDVHYEVFRFDRIWLLLVTRMRGNGIVAAPEPLATLSRISRVVACDEESHVMYSAAAEWREGRERWAIVHASEEGPEHLEVRGDAPAGWETTRDEMIVKQQAEEGVDYVYEVPLLMAKRVVGYRMETEDDDRLEPVAVTRRAGAGRSWWKLW